MASPTRRISTNFPLQTGHHQLYCQRPQPGANGPHGKGEYPHGCTGQTSETTRVVAGRQPTRCFLRAPRAFQFNSPRQQNDQKVTRLLIDTPERYQYKTLGGFPIIHTAGQHSKMVLTDVMLPMAVNWFHEATAHNAGISHLEDHLKFHFFHPRLSAEARDQVSKCDLCQ